ncbi:SpoIID/LytB domain-containing protein [Sutcliffiella horikoshii]|uniref:SpoIID/LytB domain-containing protein n=1 Tax=Sutcliffiella horikoshii TaxID=79883 RepID=UPI003CF62F79
MKKWIVSLLVACLVFLPSLTQVEASSAASIPNEVSVKLKYHLKERKAIPFNFNGTYQLVDSGFELKQDRTYEVKLNGSVIELYENSKKIKSFNQTFEIKPVKYGKSNYIRLNGRPYLGSIRFMIENNYLVPVNKLPMEDYLKGVLPSEIYPSWNIEALKAQAVAARTYALKRVHQVMTDDVGSQRYDGYIWWDHRKYENTNRAVNETKGQVLTYNDRLIDAVFSSNNGGYIESNKGAWPGGSQLDYLIAKEDPNDPAFDWNLSLREQQIEVKELDLKNPQDWWASTQESGLKNPLKFANTNESKVLTNVKNYLKKETSDLKDATIKIVSIKDVAVSNTTTPGQRRTHGSYTVEYMVQHKDGSFVMETKEVDGEEHTEIKVHSYQQVNSPITNMRSIFGINDFKSHFVTTISLKDGVYDIKGKGWGHGVGMSQYGAKAMADQGDSYVDILGFYYSGTTFSNYFMDHINNSLRGSDRYETSTAIAEYGWDKGFQTVVIGRGDNPVDALTGSVLAKKYDAPLLLVKTDEIPNSIKELLATQTIHQIFVLGGQAAVSDKTVAELRKYATQVIRIKGSDRYDTSVEVAGQIDAKGEVIITSGSSTSPDALSVASHAALNQIPILFTKVEEVSSSVEEYLRNNNVKKVTIIGGKSAVSNEVEAKLFSLVDEVKRVSGPDRYATSVAIVNEYNLDPRNLFFARGEQFIDALPGSVLAAKMEAPLLLTKKDSLPDAVSGYINTNIHYVPSVHYLGGTGAISESTRSEIELNILK